MFTIFLRRLFWMTLLLIIINFFTFAYAHYGRFAQLAANPLFAQQGKADPVFPGYLAYIEGFINGQPPQMPAMVGVNILKAIGEAGKASLGLLGIAFSLSLVIGFMAGVTAARTNPPHIAGWLIPITAASLAMPGFYIGAVLITLSVYYLLYSPGMNRLPLPLNGFGWDAHLVFPVIALTFRSAVQIAQTTAALLSEEFKKQYVSAALSLGFSWKLIRAKLAMHNIYAPLSQVAASSLRVMVGELILVEWLFGWPGLGKLLAASLQLPNIATVFGATLPATFLHPPTVATIVTAFGMVLVVVDLMFGIFAYHADPRLRERGMGGAHD